MADELIVINVYRNEGEFITGGGYIVLSENAIGEYSGDVGSKMNFGFNIKYNKKGTNLQGKLKGFIRQTKDDGRHVYKIQTNSTTMLAVEPDNDPDTGKAVFTAKANIQDVTDPTNPISLDGGLTLQATVDDQGEPGSEDRISFTLRDSSGNIVFSSDWQDGQTQETVLSGGNLVVHDAHPLRLANGLAYSGTVAAHTTREQVADAAATAMALWSAAGVSHPEVHSSGEIHVRVADLVGAYLGLAYPALDLIVIDDDAAGQGWHRVDLLSVVSHEVGHILGLDHDHMEESLDVFERHIPKAALSGPSDTELAVDRVLAKWVPQTRQDEAERSSATLLRITPDKSEFPELTPLSRADQQQLPRRSKSTEFDLNDGELTVEAELLDEDLLEELARTHWTY
jgi:hypothetical protein